MNRLRLTGARPTTALAAFATRPSIPRGPSWPVGLVTGVDYLVAPTGAGSAGQDWVKMRPSRISLPWQGTSVILVPRMNENPAASIAFRFASEIMPASATTVTSGSWWAAMNFSVTGSMVFVSARLPSNAETNSGKPSCPVSSPIVICALAAWTREFPAGPVLTRLAGHNAGDLVCSGVGPGLAGIRTHVGITSTRKLQTR